MDLDTYNLKMADYEMSMDAFAAFRIHNLQPTSSALLEVCLQRAVKTEGETTPANPLLEGLTMVCVCVCVCACVRLCVHT